MCFGENVFGQKSCIWPIVECSRRLRKRANVYRVFSSLLQQDTRFFRMARDEVSIGQTYLIHLLIPTLYVLCARAFFIGRIFQNYGYHVNSFYFILSE